MWTDYYWNSQVTERVKDKPTTEQGHSLDVDSSDLLAADCIGDCVFSLMSCTTLLPDCPSLNGVLDAVADGVLNSVTKLVFICVVDSTDGANATGFTSDFGACQEQDKHQTVITQ